MCAGLMKTLQLPTVTCQVTCVSLISGMSSDCFSDHRGSRHLFVDCHEILIQVFHLCELTGHFHSHGYKSWKNNTSFEIRLDLNGLGRLLSSDSLNLRL